MKKELLSLIETCELSPFNSSKTLVRTGSNSIFKTKDAKAVYTKVLGNISKEFVFADTANLLQNFSFTQDFQEIKKRQEFFSAITNGLENSFLENLKIPRPNWKPKYNVAVVTEDEKTFSELQKLGCPVRFVLSETDIKSLEECDVVQVIDCETYSMALEQLPQAVFLNSTDEAYLERYVIQLSGWKYNLEFLKVCDGEIKKIVEELEPIVELTIEKNDDKINREIIEAKVEKMNSEISGKIRDMTISGDLLMTALTSGVLPEELQAVVKETIKDSGIPANILIRKLPVEIDEEELEKILRNQDLNEFGNAALKIKKKVNELLRVPELLERMEKLLLLYDFEAGVSKWMGSEKVFPNNSEDFVVENGRNLFLENPQPISFYLNASERCSILTGANSGGKTTLLEHVLQYISLYQIGLTVSGNIRMPLFSEVYYFAKSKGSMSKGAFETLLTQMSEIKPGRQTLILADEIEAVTEPGVAGKMITATADYFIQRGCFLIVATHLGQEIQKSLPSGARIDGIEAKGLSAENELIVDHNPVLGRLAHSTPELIVEKMAKVQGGDYFNFIYRAMRNSENNF